MNAILCSVWYFGVKLKAIVRYLRVQLNAILGSSYKTLVLWSKIESNTKRWYLRIQLNAILVLSILE